MPDNEKKITKLDEDDLSAVAGGRGRTLFSRPYCRVCGKKMGRGPSLFVFVCGNVSCSRFNVITPSGECLWK